MKKSNLRAECTMLEDQREEAAAEATALADQIESLLQTLREEQGWGTLLAKDVSDLARENTRLKQVIRLLTKSL